MVICCRLVCLKIVVFSSDLISFQMNSCTIVIAREGDHGYWSPSLPIIRLDFNIPDVIILSKSLVCVKSLGLMKLVLSFA